MKILEPVKKIIYNKNFVDFICFLLPKTKLKNKYRSFIKEIEKKDSWILQSYQSMGDTIILSLLMKPFKKKYGGRVTFLFSIKMLSDFAQSFKYVDEALFQEIDFSIDSKMEKGKIYTIDMLRSWENKSKYKNMLEIYRSNLNIDDPIDFDHIKPNKKNKKIIKETFEKLNLRKNKTIFLSPFAVTFNYKLLSDSFWKKLADGLLSKDYDVVFNTKSKIYENYKRIFLPIAQTIAFVHLCHSYISFRSGLDDVISSSQFKQMSVIYPKEQLWLEMYSDQQAKDMLKLNFHYNEELSFVENVIRITSVKDMYQNDSVDEIIFNNDEEELLNYLLSKY